MTFASPNTRFRVALLVFAGILGLQALWLLPAEMLRSGPRTLPLDETSAQRAYSHGSSAFWIARWSAVRGDLWSEAANAYATLVWKTPEQIANDATSVQRARESAQRTLALAPHRASTWLLLAGLASRLGWTELNPTALLKTSYYTGPSELPCCRCGFLSPPNRTRFDDPEIAQFVRRDVRMILSQRSGTQIGPSRRLPSGISRWKEVPRTGD